MITSNHWRLVSLELTQMSSEENTKAILFFKKKLGRGFQQYTEFRAMCDVDQDFLKKVSHGSYYTLTVADDMATLIDFKVESLLD